MATNGIREGRARFGDDVRERARKYFEAQKGKKDTAEAFPVKPAKEVKGRELSDAAFKSDLEDRMEMPRGTLERKQFGDSKKKTTKSSASEKPTAKAEPEIKTTGDAFRRIYSEENAPKSKLPQQKGGLGILGAFVDEDKVRSDSQMKKGGRVKKMAKGGSVRSSASKRADGVASRGKTKGRFV